MPECIVRIMHGGYLAILSSPGKICFQVCLSL